MRKKNVKLWKHLIKELNDFNIQAGWFDTKQAKIAAAQNYGAKIKHPGGQPYFIDSKTKLAVFVSKDIPFSENLPHTKPHTIVIPARPFMDNAKRRVQGAEGREVLLQELLRVFEGRQTMNQAVSRLGAWVQGVIQEEIKKIQSPPLAPSTIRQRNSKYTTRSKNKSTKPLIDEGIMFSSVQYKYELKK